jgi:hypothetical protein
MAPAWHGLAWSYGRRDGPGGLFTGGRRAVASCPTNDAPR